MYLKWEYSLHSIFMRDEEILRWKGTLGSVEDKRTYLQSIDLTFSGKVQGSENKSEEEIK